MARFGSGVMAVSGDGSACPKVQDWRRAPCCLDSVAKEHFGAMEQATMLACLSTDREEPFVSCKPGNWRSGKNGHGEGGVAGIMNSGESSIGGYLSRPGLS